MATTLGGPLSARAARPGMHPDPRPWGSSPVRNRRGSLDPGSTTECCSGAPATASLLVRTVQQARANASPSTQPEPPSLSERRKSRANPATTENSHQPGNIRWCRISRTTGSAASPVGCARRPPKLPASLSAARLPEDDLQDGGVYLSLEFADLDLAGRDVASVEIDRCRYRNVSFGQAKLDRALICDSVFDRCDLANLQARDCSLLRVAVSGSRMTGLSWAEGSVREVTFDTCRMDLASFRFSTLKGVVFTGCKLTQADFHEADLRGARFDSCDLTGAQFSKAQMEGTRFADCNLTGLNGVTSLKGATVQSRDALALTYAVAGALGITIEDD